MKAVLDTSVYISMLLSPRGAGAWLMALWSEERYELVISPELFAEFVEVSNQPEIKQELIRKESWPFFGGCVNARSGQRERLRLKAYWLIRRMIS